MTFSIVIATFNPGEKLDNAIQSILNQTFKDFEIVIQDNNSTEKNTLEIFGKYKDVISIHRAKDKGIYDAFNHAISKCIGQWVMFLGADDVLNNQDVLKSIHEYTHLKSALILGKIKNTEIQNHWVPENFQSQMTSSIVWRNTIHQQGCCYSRDWLKHHPFPTHTRILGDYAVHLQAYLEKTPVIETNLTFAICQANGISKNFNKELYREELTMKKEILPLHFYLLNWPWVKFKYWMKSS